MDIVFLGTPAFAVPALRALSASRHRVVLAITRPDRPRGRGLATKPTPVRSEAERLGIMNYWDLWPVVAAIEVYLPEGQTVEDAVLDWPDEYPDIIDAVEPDYAGTPAVPH